MQSFGLNLTKELCFVWGAPLSGQRRWMLRSAELTKPEIAVTLCFSRPDESLASLLKRVEGEMAAYESQPISPFHIYVELPAALLHEDFEIEEWIALHKDWSVSFSGIVNEEAHLLSEYYHELYEEFSRSSQSVVVLGRSQENKNEMPLWIQNKDMDFGKHVPVFEDDLWPKALLKAEADPKGLLKEWTEEIEEVEFPISLQEKQSVEVLLKLLIKGELGPIWGAEIVQMRSTKSETDRELSVFTICGGALYEWRSSTRARCVGLSSEVALLSLAGVALQKNNILQSLRNLHLLADS